MAKVIKILFYTFTTIFLIWALLAIFLSQVGLETKRFNPLIIDLKTTIDASPKGFQRSVANYRYYVQASHYLDVVEMVTGTRPQAFLFVVVEKQRPFSPAVYMAAQAMIDLGKQHAREDLNRIAQWIAIDKFPGYSERVEEISLPKWMLPKEDGSPANYQPIELY